VHLLDDLWTDQAGEQVQLLPFLLATVPLPNIWPLATGKVGATGVAAQRTAVQLLNPAGSNVDLVLVGGTCRGDLLINSRLQLFQDPQALTTQVTNVAWIDSKGRGGAPVGQLHSDVDFTEGGLSISEIMTIDAIDVDITVYIAGTVLAPGEGIVLVPRLDDHDVGASFQWMESLRRK